MRRLSLHHTAMTQHCTSGCVCLLGVDRLLAGHSTTHMLQSQHRMPTV